MPDGFRFAPKLALTRLDRLTVSLERLAALGDRLGPVRVVDRERARRRAARLHPRARSIPAVELAFDFRHESWRGVEGVVTVNDLDAEPFRYIRLREPPYSDDDLAGARGDAARRRRTSTSATRTSRPRRPTRRGWSSSSPRGLRDRAGGAGGGGFESTSTAAASSTAIATTLSPTTLRPTRAMKPSPAPASRGRTTKWWNAPQASTSATSAIFTSSTWP